MMYSCFSIFYFYVNFIFLLCTVTASIADNTDNSNMACKLDLNNFVLYGKKILGAGLNYKSIVKERNLPLPTKPILFLKPSSSYIQEGQIIEVPKEFDVWEEVELGVIIGERCKNVSTSEAMKYVGGYCLALDLTAVDDLKEAREKGLPWTFGKGFDTACPVSKFIPRDCLNDPKALNLSCSVNGKLLQNEKLTDMIFSIEELISYSSQFMTLEPYDLILTGSPGGNGPIRPGDIVEAKLSDVLSIKFNVKQM